MIETVVTILINRKSDEKFVRQIIIDQQVNCPVYFFEFEDYFKLIFTSDYEQWELDTAILNHLPDYVFTSDLGKGGKEIRLQISRYQSPLSTDGWNRRIEDPLNQTKYLIEKSNSKPERFTPNVKVLFGKDEQNYFINVVEGVNTSSGQTGFLLLNDFSNKVSANDSNVLKDTLYKTPSEAFSAGYYKMQKLVDKDFEKHIENGKKLLKEQQKIPRKIIREFISACNNNDHDKIFKNLDRTMTFELRENCQTKIRLLDIEAFKDYIKSPNQELCSKNLKIRSSWNFKFSSVTIGVKYFLADDNVIDKKLHYEQIRFELNEDKVVSLTVDR